MLFNQKYYNKFEDVFNSLQTELNLSPLLAFQR